MTVLSPGIAFCLLGAGRSWPSGTALSNRDIFMLNHELSKKSDKILAGFEAKLRSTYGYGSRYMTRLPGSMGNNKNEETAESLAYAACREAVSLADSNQVQALILGSTTSCRYSGSQAAAVAGRLQCQPATWEVKAGCSTSLACLAMGTALLGQGFENVLVACAETLSKVVNPAEKESWFGLADGAGAVWMHAPQSAFVQRGKAEGRHCVTFVLKKMISYTLGEHVDLYTTRGMLPPDDNETEGMFMSGDPSALKELAEIHYENMLNHLLPTPAHKAAVNAMITHQVNRQLIESLRSRHGLNCDLFWDGDVFGNLGGTSILFSLAHALQNQGFAGRTGDILLMSVGGGLTCHGPLWSLQS